MNLIRVTGSEGSYSVEAEKRYRLFKLTVFARKKRFSYDGKDWTEEGSKRKVSGKYRRQLNRWLRDHQKYIIAVSRRNV